jgi:hypothetical protein
MNGRVAKLLRKTGKVDKESKRLYNKLSHTEKGMLLKFYKYMIEKKETEQLTSST